MSLHKYSIMDRSPHFGLACVCHMGLEVDLLITYLKVLRECAIQIYCVLCFV